MCSSDLDRMIIVGMQQGELNTLYRMRGLLANMTTMARLSPFFQERTIAEDATFFDPHVHFGMVSACEPTGMLGRIHYGDIMRIVLMGNDERVSPQTALRIGLVSEITPRDKLWARAHEIAAIIAKKPSVATQGTVRAVWESRDLPPSQSVENALKDRKSTRLNSSH